MDEQVRATILAVLEDVMNEINALEDAMVSMVPGSEEEALQGLRRMIIERLNAK